MLENEDGFLSGRIVGGCDLQLLGEPRDLRVVKAVVVARTHQDKVVTPDRDMPVCGLVPRRREVTGYGVLRFGPEFVVAEHRLRLGSGPRVFVEIGEEAIEFGRLSPVRDIPDDEYAVQRLILCVVVAVTVGVGQEVTELRILFADVFGVMYVARNDEAQNRDERGGVALVSERLRDRDVVCRCVADALAVLDEGV